VRTGAKRSGELALRMAGVALEDIDVLELYDCYTYTVLVTLEDYGFCEKGEGGAFVSDGKLAPGGSLPCNTGGGQLSSFYMWGFTPLSEGVIQARGQGGRRQVAKHDHVLVSGNGGALNFHSTTILSTHEGDPGG
jgi:acetyl-CoA acetyltransferase